MADHTVFVSNINYATTSTELAESFQQFGKVIKARIITEFFRGQRRSRGIGFVDFETVEGMNAAVAKQTMELSSRQIKMAPARPPTKHPRVTLFIGGIPEGLKEEELKANFNEWKPTEVRIIRHNTAEARGFGFITFASEEAQAAALAAHPTLELGGQASVVKVARPRPRLHQRRAPTSGARPARAPTA